jgi:hypothetical protein
MADKWEDDLVQFARLLCEIVATQDNLQIDALCESMDLLPENINELFERANVVWEKSKNQLLPVKVDLTYFKESGKYYSSGECEVSHKPLFEIWNEIEQMNPHPGLSGQWSQGFILVNTDHENAHPHIIVIKT